MLFPNFLLFIAIFFQQTINWEAEVKSVITANDLDIVYFIESKNELDALGDGVKAIGVLQIHKRCVEDVNSHYGLSYDHKDMYGRIDATDVFYKYLALGGSLFHEKFKRKPTKIEYLRMWNGGIYNGYKKTATLDYIDKFLKESNRRKN